MRKTMSFIMTFLVVLSGFSASFAQGESNQINSAGYGSTYVIKSDNSLWGCGSQYVGNGTGYKEKVIDFTKIMDDVRSVSSGGFQKRVAVKNDDTLWGWGSFDGHPAEGGKYDPTFLFPTQFSIDDVKKASASDFYVLALKNDNSLWLCGDMYRGDGTTDMATGKDGFVLVAENVIDMFAADESVFLIKDDNTLWGYGENNDGEMGNMTDTGDGTVGNNDDVYRMVKILDDVKYVTSDKDGSVVMAIREDNSLYAWGSQGFFTEDYGWIEDAGKPYKVMDDVKYVAVDSDVGFVVKNDDSLWSWGYSYQGDSVGNEKEIRKIADDIRSITLGERHASIVKTDNTLWTMGGAYRGGLGYESKETWYTPLTKIIDNVKEMPASWASEEVEKAIGAKLIPEELQNNYSKAINRKEFCTLAIRMIEVKEGKSIESHIDDLGLVMADESIFIDCTDKNVLAAKTLGITDGTSENTFDPLNILTREEAAKFLTATAIACDRDVKLISHDYSDSEEIEDWSKPYTGYVNEIGLMKGLGGNKFSPKDPYQRQEAFVIMYRIWKDLDSKKIAK
ncbi:MAG: S-layer homology domain-containing protein [Firmicutes bacterium]|jgi:alpha-tubulin suppressor-like RCC1 family protein|nr:S-layer homology domain-containing protein [Bacillota bacterium]